jgi:branched-subunit amino acid ABC-type transport system permease component
MDELFGVPLPALAGQVVLGLINGAFYALLSLGLALIFGMLNIINFAHGAQYMMGAFVAWALLTHFGLGYFWALLIAPIVVGLFGVLMERTLLRKVYRLEHLYGLLLTFGVALLLEGAFRQAYGVSGMPYAIPGQLSGATDVQVLMIPNYRIWVVIASLVLCAVVWYVIERTRLGTVLRAATENPVLVRSFGVRVPRLVTATYGFGAALAAIAGVLAAPIYSVNPLMGSNLIIVVFAVVVIGGMGSMFGSIVTGFSLGILEGLAKLFYPEASSTVAFAVMAVVLLVRPNGLFGRV